MAKSTLVTGYSTSQMLIISNLKGISHEDSMMLPGSGGNSINWIAGHILTSRTSILKLVGGDRFLSQEEAAPYGREVERLNPGDKCESMERIREGLESTEKDLQKKLRDIPDSALAQNIDMPGFPFKLEEPTLDAYLTFLLYHEGYHTGQLGLCRCVIGKEPRIG